MVRKLLSGFLSILFIPFLANAEIQGVSDLGLCHPQYNFKGLREQFKGSPVIATGFLDNTFNPKGCPNLDRLLRLKKKIILRIHVINSPGLRNKRLEPHEIHAGVSRSKLDSQVRKLHPAFVSKYAARLNALNAQLSKRQGNIQLLVSPCLECDLSKPARMNLLMLTNLHMPNAILVDNPLKGSCVSGVLCERHGDTKSGDILDLDGISLSEVNINLWRKKTKAKYLRLAWQPCNNGLKKGQEWVPPTKRKNFCNQKQIQLSRKFLLN